MGDRLLDIPALLIEALDRRLHESYRCTYGSLEPEVPEIACWAAELALENIARTDATYHDVEHTMIVTWVGLELLRCQHLREGAVTPRDWLHVVVSLLCHDIGYVRGVCRGDRPGAWITVTGAPIDLPPGSTDASLMPWHVDRGMRFVEERFATSPWLDVAVITHHIDYTRFPVPEDPGWHETRSLSALVRAADLIGQLADPYYLRKIPALFHEFKETGLDARLGFSHAGALRDDFPHFYERSVLPWIRDALELLSTTARGRTWIASLHAHVYQASQRHG